jgi:parallel beta-helix repeat protein
MKKRKGVLLLALLLIVVQFPVVHSSPTILSPYQSTRTETILYVGGAGPGNFSDIQEAIDSATDGDIVFVYDDSSPYEETLWINVSISLLGENRDTTIIKGQEDQDIIRIHRDNVVIQGFTIQGISPSHSDRGIFILADSLVITDTTIQDASMGIYAVSNYSSFTNNEFSSLYRGMWLLESHDCVVSENTFGLNVEEDITIGGSDCLIDHNTFTGRYGIKVWRSDHTAVSNNTLSATCLIDLYESNNNTICGNTFEDGGFTVYKSVDNLAFDNTRDNVPIVYLDGQKDKTISNAAQVLLVNCKNIKVQGITFTDIPNGIYLARTTTSDISGNTFLNCAEGIRLTLSSIKNSVSSCQFTACSQGVVMDDYSDYNNITNNILSDSDAAAILIESSWNKIINNSIMNATLGISLTPTHPYQQPTYPKYRRGNIVSSNMVQNAQYGIVVDACFTKVKNNRVTDCEIGIGITDLALFSFDILKGNIIQGNSIENNQYGLMMNLTSFTTIIKNNFISNGQQVLYEGVGLLGQLLGTRWSRNYWGEPSILPRMIPGFLYIQTDTYDKISFTKIDWIEIDWLPAQQPYPLPS